MTSTITVSLGKREHCSLRLRPEVKREAEKLASNSNRSLGNLIETVLDEHIRRQHQAQAAGAR